MQWLRCSSARAASCARVQPRTAACPRHCFRRTHSVRRDHAVRGTATTVCEPRANRPIAVSPLLLRRTASLHVLRQPCAEPLTATSDTLCALKKDVARCNTGGDANDDSSSQPAHALKCSQSSAVWTFRPALSRINTGRRLACGSSEWDR
eukprot:4858822-Pleurochrysis_carterae.AAC.2